MILFAPQSSHAAKKEGLWPSLCEEIDALSSLAAVEGWWADYQITRLRHTPLPFIGPLRDRLDLQRRELTALAQSRYLDLQYSRAMERDL